MTVIAQVVALILGFFVIRYFTFSNQKHTKYKPTKEQEQAWNLIESDFVQRWDAMKKRYGVSNNDPFILRIEDDLIVTNIYMRGN